MLSSTVIMRLSSTCDTLAHHATPNHRPPVVSSPLAYQNACVLVGLASLVFRVVILMFFHVLTLVYIGGTARAGKVLAVRTHRDHQIAVKIVEKSSLSPVSCLRFCFPSLGVFQGFVQMHTYLRHSPRPALFAAASFPTVQRV